MLERLFEFAGNHPLLSVGLLAALVAVIAFELRLRGRSSSYVSAADAVRLLNKGATVIDVRDPEEFRSGHIVNARNVQLSEIESGTTAIGKNKKKVVLTICGNGTSSAKAAALLRKAGYEQTFSIRGGISGWRADNMPVVK